MPIVQSQYRGRARTGSGLPRPNADPAKRVRIIYAVLLAVSTIFIVRLFYLQVIRHDFYVSAARDYQLKEYQIPAVRGVILAQNGSGTTPLVLNEVKYTLFADPVYVKEPEKHAVELAAVLQGDAGKITEQLKTPNTRYVVLAKRLDKSQADAIDKLDIAGVGTREESYRTYPQGQLAAQLLGFVNDAGKGQYGIEQSLDKDLSGIPGELKAITDAKGVPLVSNPDNIVTAPESGEAVTLTVDIGMQRQVEDLLKAGLDRAQSQSGSVTIIDPNTGAIKAMANYPTYDPAKVSEVTNLAALSNAAANAPLEVGSIMKSLTTAAALDQGVVTPNTSFYNGPFVQVGDRKITDVHNSEGTQTVESLLVKSLNTGAVWLLKQIGHGDINERARYTWYDYMTRHFFLGSATGVEQAGEADGYIPDPKENNDGIDVTYANTAFGQGMSATPLQMAAAFSSIVNGGTYYKPRLVASTRGADGKDHPTEPVVKKEGVISGEASTDIVALMQRVLSQNFYGFSRSGYMIGGKTGTAEFINPETGLYYKDRFNGTYIGFVGGNRPEYVIMVRVDDPKTPGFAGSAAAAPLFRDVVNMMIDNFGVTPKS